MLRTKVFWKIYLCFIVFILFTSLLVGFFVTFQIERDELRQTEERLKTHASLLSGVTPNELESGSPELKKRVRELNEKLKVRLTLIKADGVVVADSDEDAVKMDNHGSRPEVVQALQNGIGISTRYSNTVQRQMMYVALPLKDNGRIVGFSRASFYLSNIDERLAHLRNIGILGISIGALAALLIGLLLARQMVHPLTRMTELADSIAGGNYQERVPANRKDEFGDLARALNTMAAQISDDITERETAEAKLQEAHDLLEMRVAGRTAELTRINALLKEQISVRERAEAVLQASEERYELASRATNDVIYDFDLLTNQITWNEGIITLFGYSPKEINSDYKWWEGHLHPDDLERVCRGLDEAIEQGREYWSDEYRYRRADGSYAYILDRGYIILDEDKKPFRMIGAMTDITERKNAEIALKESEERYRVLVENASDIIYTIDLEGNLTSINKAGERLTGYVVNLASKFSFYKIIAPEHHELARQMMRQKLDNKGGRTTYEVDVITADHKRLTLEINSQLIFHESEPVGVQGIARDVTERRWAENQVRHNALHDGLTGLPNRSFFLSHLEIAIERRKGRGEATRFAVLFLDIDRFKVINDGLGHLVGDKLLIEVADRLKNCLRADDTVARFGGDEFTVLLSEVRDVKYVEEIAERILSEISRPFFIDEHEIFTSTSIGIAVSENTYKKPEELLRDADTAMYRAKNTGRARYQIFDQTMHVRAANLLKTETDLRKALERDEFEIHYQPIIRLRDNQITGFEALLRWQHPERGLIPPAEFIPVAEESGMIVPIGNWVLRESCRQLKHWRDEMPEARQLTMSVNISVKQLARHGLIKQITHILDETQIAPQCLNLEITESAIMEHSESAKKLLRRLKDLGVQLTTDDFGTGYSSLNYLHRFPIDRLKIDRTFVWGITTQTHSSEIVKTILTLARTLKMDVVAEGVENEEQIEALKKFECEYAQGYLFSKPVVAAEAEKLLKKQLSAQSLQIETTIVTV